VPIIDLTEKTYDEVIQNNDLVLIDFWQPFSPLCVDMLSSLKEVAEEMQVPIKIAAVNCVANNQIAMRYGVSTTPTLLLFQQGTPIKEVVGFQSKDEIRKLIDQIDSI
jgi:thioredoxin 1